MRKRSKLIVSKLAAAIVIILIFVISFGLSWIVTCGVIKLITMCFGLTFKWSIATGIWLILCLLRGSFNATVEKKENKPRWKDFMNGS